MTGTTVIWVFRVLAGMATTMMVSSPSLLMYRVHKQKHVGVASIVPLAALLANSHIWATYGFLTRNWFPVFACFFYGEMTAIGFLLVYTYYCSDKHYVVRVLAAFVFVLALVTTYAIVGGLGYTGQTTKQVSTIVGMMADVAGIFLYGAPMEKLFQVLKHKSAVFINVHMVIAGLVNNSIWLIYGILITNWFIMFINVLFVVVNSFTLCLYRVYDPRTHPLKDGWDISDDTDDRVSVSIEMTPRLENITFKKTINSLPSPEYSTLASPVQN